MEKQVDEIMEVLYNEFASEGGYLFGLQPEQRGVVRVVVAATLRIKEAINKSKDKTKSPKGVLLSGNKFLKELITFSEKDLLKEIVTMESCLKGLIDKLEIDE